MKKITLALAVMICTAMISKAQTPQAPKENPNAPEAVYEKEVIDYGTIEYDADGNREFKFKNVGKEPLIVYNATGSCGCTTPSTPKEPIKPGETGIIKVHYDTKRPGHFEKTVTVSSNAKTPTKVLKIMGDVKPAPVAPATPSTTPASH